MKNELEKFMDLNPKEFVERMTNATDEDWDLLDEALKENWPGSGIIHWTKTFFLEERVNPYEENLVDTACSILYRLAKDYFIQPHLCLRLTVKLSKDVLEGDYGYARFRAARLIFFFGIDKDYSEFVLREQVDKAVAVLQEFSKDEEVREIALSDLAQID